MGMFSWIDVTDKENIYDGDPSPTLLLPKEAIDDVADYYGVNASKDNVRGITGRGVTGNYDGYGRIFGYDIHETIAFINICLTTDEDFSALIDYVKEHNRGSLYTTDELIQNMEDIRQTYKKEECDIISINRDIGIAIACYDEDNARLPYPIKLTNDKNITYEEATFSMSDPNQGFFKERLEYSEANAEELMLDIDPTLVEETIEDVKRALNECIEQKTKIYEAIAKEREDVFEEDNIERE